LSGSLFVGCSGWQYRHWRGNFYPQELPLDRWLEHYASVFDTVEVNNSFYRLPEGQRFAAWRQQTPSRFLFAVKASRYLTHMKKLKDPREPLSRFFSRAKRLGRKLGPVLYQLPPRWKCDAERLADFLRALPRGRRHVFEFRDLSWYREEVFALLVRYRTALCLHDMPGSESPRRAVGPFVYLRFHGAGAHYGGRYPDSRLSPWADWIRERLGDGLNVFAYFNNDQGGHAPRDARRLEQMVNGA
jgi:uncharacterized protein YecE (DUF72 family)